MRSSIVLLALTNSALAPVPLDNGRCVIKTRKTDLLYDRQFKMKNNIAVEEFLKEILSLPEFIGFSSIGIHTHGNWNSTPLHIAATRDNVEAIAALLDAGSDINSRGEHGYTPLHEAVEQSNIEAVRLLLLRGASVTIKNDDGHTPIQCAKICREHAIEKLLQTYAAT